MFIHVCSGVSLLLHGQPAEAQVSADEVYGRGESIAVGVDQRHDGHGGLAFRSLVAASHAVEVSLHAQEVSDLGVLGVARGRLHLSHHKLVLGTHSPDLSFAFFGLLFLDDIVLNLGQVNSKVSFEVFFTRTRTDSAAFGVGIGVVVGVATEAIAKLNFELHLQAEVDLFDSDLTVLVVDFRCCLSDFIGVVNSLFERSLHFREALVEAAADNDGVSISLVLTHLEIFLRLTDHQNVRVLEVFASPGDIKLSFNLVFSLNLGLLFYSAIFKADGGRSIRRNDEVEADLVVSIGEVSTFPVSYSLLGMDESVLLLLAILHSVAFLTLTFVVKDVKSDILFSLERHIQAVDVAASILITDLHVDLAVHLFARAIVRLLRLNDHPAFVCSPNVGLGVGP